MDNGLNEFPVVSVGGRSANAECPGIGWVGRGRHHGVRSRRVRMGPEGLRVGASQTARGDNWTFEGRTKDGIEGRLHSRV